MGLAAWPGGIADLIAQPDWNDILAATFRDIYGTSPTPEDLQDPPPDALRTAKEVALREKHALHAADLALISWTAQGSGERYQLIDDTDLRNTYGHLIGQLAASHWWSVDAMADKFSGPILGAPVTVPDAWTVDPLKLACLLRTSDAAHIDARRAPAFLRVIRRPGGGSDEHWAFQGHLQRPRREDDRLVYTASTPFRLDEAPAWWLCFETLQMIDRELHGVDNLLAERSRDRFAARNVKGADGPTRLSSLVPTVGWTPVDSRVVVSNVGLLVRMLGGKELYGDQPHVALRELIQNATDATLALHAALGVPPQPVDVALRQEEDVWWLDVADSGIGMSEAVMVGPLLDFGRSYWGSQLMRRETPGLAAGNFRSIGQYGIGFFSVFMLGDQVRVTTRRYDEASSATRVLEFEQGLKSRPILRPATASEQRHSGGTVISVRLKTAPRDEGGLLTWRGTVSTPRCESCAPG
jgi:hypothetical protein